MPLLKRSASEYSTTRKTRKNPTKQHRLKRSLYWVLFLCVPLLLWFSFANVQKNAYQRSVKDFGATGDGTTDDRKAIQAAIDDVAGHGGGVVYFPVGIYSVSIYTPSPGQFPWPRALTIRPNVKLQGENWGSSLIKLANNQAPYGALIAPDPLEADVSGFQMSDLGVDLNGLNNPLPTTAEINEPVWNKRRARNTVFIYKGTGLRFERCRFTNFIGVWCLMLYSYKVSDVTITDNLFDSIGGGNLNFDSSTVDTAGYDCRITNNRFYSRNYDASGGPLSYGVRTAIEVHNINALVANNQVYGFPIGINLGGNSEGGNESHTASGNLIKDAYDGIVVWSVKPDDGSSVGMQNCSIRDNTIILNVDGWQAYVGKGGHCTGISIGRGGNMDAEIRNLEVADNHISYLNYNGARDTMDDAYSAGICYDRWNLQRDTIGAESDRLRFANNTIDHPLGNGFFFRALIKGLEISGNTVIDAAAGPTTLWDGWRAALFFMGPESDVDVINNRFVDNRPSPRMPCGIYAINDNFGYCDASGNRLIDRGEADLSLPMLRRDKGAGNWNISAKK